MLHEDSISHVQMSLPEQPNSVMFNRPCNSLKTDIKLVNTS